MPSPSKSPRQATPADTDRPTVVTERWQVDDDAAAAYERYLVPAVFGPFADRLIELAQPRPADRALDVACGTGIVARRLAPRVRHTVGLDLNAGMLAVARSNNPSIEWLAGDAAATALPDGSFDLVVCQQGLQYIPDRTAAVLEMRRLLAPGGRLALSAWRAARHNPAWLLLAEALDRHAGPKTGAIMRAPFELGAAELRTLVREAGFRDVAVRIRIAPVRFPSVEDLVLRQQAASPLAEPLSRLTDLARDALVQDLTRFLHEYTDHDGVSFPMQTHVVTAIR
jgi:SAM-dependent methyltransferase